MYVDKASALCANKPDVISSMSSSSSSYVSLEYVISQEPSTINSRTLPLLPKTSETMGAVLSVAVFSILKVDFSFTVKVPSPLISTLALLVSVMVISTV